MSYYHSTWWNMKSEVVVLKKAQVVGPYLNKGIAWSDS
jgi:hypothetical protein